TYYGADTEKVVRKFQQENKLVVNGIMDEVTLNELDSLLEKGFKKGMRSAEVQKMKKNLVKIGFGTHWNNPTTLYGSDTEKVVREFQAYYSLLVDGEMHIASMNKLDEVLSSPYQKGK